ncbi:MAG: flagellar basal body P-ring formation protein FlgA [Candidatus Sericytochromatia bacterium]|nr:flagellar basal body P-ring formation protein FlgA [Candidatus Tanganyikabacteria bacterium]
MMKLLQAATAGLALAAGLAFAVASPALALTERECVEFVRGQAALMYRVPASNVAVRWDGPRLAEILPKPANEATLALDRSLFKLSGTMPVPLQVWQKGTRVATIYPRLTINVQQEVAVATDRIGRGRVLDGAVVRIEKRPIGASSTQPFTSLEGVLGAVSRMDIPAGTVLTGAMIEVPPVVKGGQMVSVRLVSGGLLIMSSGQVLQDGRPGQLVRILNTKSQRDFLARVVGPDLVEVNIAEEEEGGQ